MDTKASEISRATIGRIPIYLNYLKETTRGEEHISATTIAKALGLGEVQVRKDLAVASGVGRPKTGYHAKDLITSLEKFLGQDEHSPVVIVGAGKLGQALLDYGGFHDYGLDIIAAFDKAVAHTVQSHSGKPIYPMTDFETFVKMHDVKIGVIAVPASEAQKVCDLLIGAGIRAIWCFAPVSLTLPSEIPVQYENMGLSLAYLNKKINK